MSDQLGEDRANRWSSERVFDLYSGLLKEIWEIASELLGEAIISILFTSAIRKLSGRYSFISSIRVSEDGILLGGLKEPGRNISPFDLHRAFQSLIANLFDLFSVLAEGVVSRELFPRVFPKVREAERIIFPK